jgi:hypothetical protein
VPIRLGCSAVNSGPLGITARDELDRLSPLAAGDTLRKAGGMIKARAVPAPSDNVLAPLYAGADLLDAFAIHLPPGASDDLEVLARALFERQAGWIRALTWVRDAVMATVGVKSIRSPRRREAKDRAARPFPTPWRSSD